VHYLVHVVPIVQPGGEIQHVIEMSTDISDLKKLHREKREAERLAAVGETVAGIAHGIKNVLMGLEGGMYVFNTGLEKGDEERISQGWQMLQGNIFRISRFVREFLDFAKGRPPEVALVDPSVPARKVVELFQEKAAMEGVALTEDLQEGIAEAFLDEHGIHTCLTNLVSNAIHACTMSDQVRDYAVKVSSRETDGTIRYEVSDNGCGMDYEISRKIFSSFFSTKGAGDGVEALEMIREQPPDFISLDLVMPKKSGQKLLYELKEDRDLARIPVVIVTAVTDEHGDPYAFKDVLVSREQVPPPEGYFTKPIDREEFLGTIDAPLSPDAD
jgi:signal transduction histidine kinase